MHETSSIASLLPPEQVVYFTFGVYAKYCAIDRLVRRRFGEVEHYQLLFADRQRLDLVVELALPEQECAYGQVRAEGASLAREAQRMSRSDLVPIGSVHKHPIATLSSLDIELLDENLAREMAPALLRPFEVRANHPEAGFTLGPDAELIVDGRRIALANERGQPSHVLLRNAQALRTAYRARVFCLASNGGAKPRFHGQEVVVVRLAECPASHSFRRPIEEVLLEPGPARFGMDEEALEQEILDKLSLVRRRCGYSPWGWNQGVRQH